MLYLIAECYPFSCRISTQECHATLNSNFIAHYLCPCTSLTLHLSSVVLSMLVFIQLLIVIMILVYINIAVIIISFTLSLTVCNLLITIFSAKATVIFHHMRIYGLAWHNELIASRHVARHTASHQ